MPEQEVQAALSTKLQKKAHLLAQRLLQRRKELKKLVGESPYGGDALSLKERRAQYQELRGSRELLLDALADGCTIGRNGELRINKKLLEAFMEFGG